LLEKSSSIQPNQTLHNIKELSVDMKKRIAFAHHCLSKSFFFTEYNADDENGYNQ